MTPLLCAKQCLGRVIRGSPVRAHADKGAVSCPKSEIRVLIAWVRNTVKLQIRNNAFQVRKIIPLSGDKESFSSEVMLLLLGEMKVSMADSVVLEPMLETQNKSAVE